MHTMSVDPALSPRSKPVKNELEIHFFEPERMSQLSIPCPRTRKLQYVTYANTDRDEFYDAVRRHLPSPRRATKIHEKPGSWVEEMVPISSSRSMSNDFPLGWKSRTLTDTRDRNLG